MVYESNYRPARNVYDDELMHYGVKGMKWGRRKSPTTYGGSVTKSGKYRASNGVVIGRSKNKGVAVSRRLSVTPGGRALAAIGSMSLSSKQKDRLKKEQAALKEYYKVGGDKMLKTLERLNKAGQTKVGDGLYSKSNHTGQLSDGYEKHKRPGIVMGGPKDKDSAESRTPNRAKKTKTDYRRG